MGQRALRKLTRTFTQIDKADTNIFTQIDKANFIVFSHIDKTPTPGAISPKLYDTNAQIFAKINLPYTEIFTYGNDTYFSVKDPGNRLSFGISRAENENGDGKQSKRDKKNLFHITNV